MKSESFNFADLLASDLDERCPWLLARVKDDGFIYLGSCLGRDWSFMDGECAIFDARPKGLALLESMTDGSCWRVRRKIWKWESEVKRDVDPTSTIVLSPHYGYILRRFNVGCRTYNGWAIKDILIEGFLEPAEW